MSNYKKRTKADEKNVEGGYKQVVLFAPIPDFTAIAAPSTATPAVLGDDLKITTAHTFPGANGFISLLAKKHSVTTTCETTGDDGSQSLVWKAKFTILGDSSSTLGTMRALLNDNVIWLLKDQDCINATDYVQFGDECLQADHKITFDGKTTKEGLKEYTLEISVKDKKFFYSGAVTEKPTTIAPPTIATGPDYSGAIGTTAILFVTASSPSNSPLTYQWRKAGVNISGATLNVYQKANAQLADNAAYTCAVSDASGNTVISPVIFIAVV